MVDVVYSQRLPEVAHHSREISSVSNSQIFKPGCIIKSEKAVMDIFLLKDI